MKLMPDTVRIHASPDGRDGASGALKTPRRSEQTAAMDFLAHLRDRADLAPESFPAHPPVLAPTIPSELAVGAGPFPLSTDRSRLALETAHLPSAHSSQLDRPAPLEESVATPLAATGESLRVDLVEAPPSTLAVGSLRGVVDLLNLTAPPPSPLRLIRDRADHGSADAVRLTFDVASIRPLNAMEATRIAPMAFDSRGASNSVHAASIEWPWLAIATGGLSYRPLGSALASIDGERIDAFATVKASGQWSPASLAKPVIEDVTGPESGRQFEASNIAARAATAASSEIGNASDVTELSATVWLLPAELRELLERRRLRLVEDGHGGIHLFARDFALDEAQAAHWATALREACQSMNQPLHALWINGRAYEVQHGERHDR